MRVAALEAGPARVGEAGDPGETGGTKGPAEVAKVVGVVVGNGMEWAGGSAGEALGRGEDDDGQDGGGASPSS